MTTKCSIRLPEGVRPIHYNVRMEPDLEICTFKGAALIQIEILVPTKRFVLNAKELEVDAACLSGHISGAWQTAKEISYDTENERVILDFAHTIERGIATLYLHFSGVINDQMAGFYRSSYEVNGEKRTMAVTQFEDTAARRAFPCWDEPAAKATFKFRFLVPERLEVVSNMPVESEDVSDGKKEIVFAKSPVMSTYLAAFAVGEFERIGGETKDGTKVGVITIPGKSGEGRFALDVAIKVLEFYNTYFGIAYPLPKLDMLAVPDFAAGAMENWGLVTYRETALLVDKKRSPAARLQRVAIVVAHELAHQWFGNFVTMEWWTQLWLNEGFATFMEYRAVDHIFPKWKIWDQFVSNDMCSSLSTDALRTTHPIEVEINHPSEIGQNFDAISYEKGAAIIRMIHAYIGADAFRNGLHSYLRTHAYGNAVTEDLWRALERVSGKPVQRIMDSWTKQPGYPLVTVTPHPEKENTFLFTQRRFLSSGAQLSQAEAAQCWQIAIPYITGRGKKGTVLLTERETLVELPDIVHERWIKLNHSQNAFIRVKYPQALLERLGNAVQENEISTCDRVGLVNDLYATVHSGETSVIDLLTFLKAFANEKEYVVWSKITGALESVYALIADEPVEIHSRFSTIIRKMLIDQSLGLVGWEEKEGEAHSQKLLRPLLLQAASSYRHEATLREGKRRFAEFLKDKSSINPNLRGLVCRIASRNGGTEEFEALLSCYRETDRQEERNELLSALAIAPDDALVQKAIAFAFTDEVRPQDHPFFVASLPPGRASLRQWKFTQEHWDDFLHRYDGSLMLLSRSLEHSVWGLRTEEALDEAEQFLEKHPVPKASQAISQSLEKARAWIAWKKRDLPNVLSWIEKHSMSGT